MSESSMRKYYEKLCSWRPEYLYGYPSALCRFAEFICENQLDTTEIGMRAVICSSEVLYNQQRRLLERTFHCRVINDYGCAECGVLACECPEGNMHINSDHVFIEFINSDGTPASPGEVGEIVITDLHDFSYPLIRYRLGDVGSPSIQTCPCGRGLPLMDIIQGRISDLIVATDGRLVQDEILNHVSRRIESRHGKGIKQFKAIQKSREHIVFLIVKGADFTEDYLQLLDQKLHEYLGEAMNITYEYVEDIPLEKSGKLRYFVSEIQDNRFNKIVL
jgi:phenylacetate-CoA ligase